MKTILKSYSNFRKEQAVNFLRQNEIPVEYYISYPLPVIVNSEAAYTYFACPAQKRVPAEGEPLKVTYGGIDRFWILSAQSGALIRYELRQSAAKATISAASPNRSLAQLKELIETVDLQMNEIVPQFFQGEEISAEMKGKSLAGLQALLTPELFPLYQSTNPTFINWLNN